MLSALLTLRPHLLASLLCHDAAAHYGRRLKHQRDFLCLSSSACCGPNIYSSTKACQQWPGKSKTDTQPLMMSPFIIMIHLQITVSTILSRRILQDPPPSMPLIHRLVTASYELITLRASAPTPWLMHVSDGTAVSQWHSSIASSPSEELVGLPEWGTHLGRCRYQQDGDNPIIIIF